MCTCVLVGGFRRRQQLLHRQLADTNTAASVSLLRELTVEPEANSQSHLTRKSPLHSDRMWRACSGLAPPPGTTLVRAIVSRASTGRTMCQSNEKNQWELMMLVTLTNCLPLC